MRSRIQVLGVDAQPDGPPKNGASGQFLSEIVVRCRQGLSTTENLVSWFVTEFALGYCAVISSTGVVSQSRAQLVLVLEDMRGLHVL
jgi:hypothetical protein